MKLVKITVDLPDELVEQATRVAAERNVGFQELLIESLESLVLPRCELAGAFAHDSEEIARIQKLIDEEFSTIDPEDWK